MPTMQLSRETEIETSLDVLKPLLMDFNNWPLWSPWLCQEPEADVRYEGPPAEIGSSYSWNGSRIGAGGMTLSSATASLLEYDLVFHKPFKSRARVAFELSATDTDRCRVKWSMSSSLPFFLFFMRKSFEVYIGNDYERGLRMLKELAETGTVNSNTAIEAIATLPAADFIGMAGSGNLASLGPAMQQAFPQLRTAIDDAGLSTAGAPFCHYRKMDPVADYWEYTLAIPVSGEATTPGFERGTRQAMSRCAQLTHTGHYHHLGNAWATAFSWMRAEKKRFHKKHGAFEIYLDDPATSDAAALRTRLFIPLK